jgi:hypothetical protein
MVFHSTNPSLTQFYLKQLKIWLQHVQTPNQNVEPARLPQHASFFFHGNFLTKSLWGKLQTSKSVKKNFKYIQLYSIPKGSKFQGFIFLFFIFFQILWCSSHTVIIHSQEDFSQIEENTKKFKNPAIFFGWNLFGLNMVITRGKK